MKHASKESVAEIQGYYGSLSIAEKVIQQVWKRQDFSKNDLRTQTGEALKILNPGTLNHNEGPDFRSASIQLGDVVLSGDVELHLYPKDWNQHQHARDPQYRNVILHVSLFDGETPSGRNNPKHHLVLLPHLDGDLEGLLTHYVLSGVSSAGFSEANWLRWMFGDEGFDEMGMHRIIREKSGVRWRLKQRFAAERLSEVGWAQACHQMMLEVLGYSRNRAVMHRIALEHPLTLSQPSWNAVDVFESHRDEWKLKGFRPANHPLKRLQSYQKILEVNPDWPRKFLLKAHQLMRNVEKARSDGLPESTCELRKRCHLLPWIESIKESVFENQIGGNRLHTLFCDALLPLLSASTERGHWFDAWYAWPAGDYPDRLTVIAKSLRAHSPCDKCNSNGWMQACLQLMLEQEQQPVPSRGV